MHSNDNCWMDTLINSLTVYGIVYGAHKSLLKERMKGDRQGRKTMSIKTGTNHSYGYGPLESEHGSRNLTLGVKGMDVVEAYGYLRFKLDIGSGRSPERETEEAEGPPVGTVWEDRQL